MTAPADIAAVATNSANSAMDWLSFIGGVVAALAWPIAVIIVAMMFRAQISSLMPMLRKLKAGPVEAEFEGKVQKLLATTLAEGNSSSTAPTDASNSDGPAAPTSPLSTEVFSDHAQARAPAAFGVAYELAKTLPRAAVITAWLEVDQAVIRLARRTSEANDHKIATIAPAYELMLANSQLGLVTPDLAERYQDLRIMRNKVMETEDFNPATDAVVEYIHLVTDLVKKIDAIPGRVLPIFAHTGRGNFVPPDRRS